MSTVVSEFDIKRDPRKRFTISAATFEHYHVKVFNDGHIELYPRVLTDPTISIATLERMDEVMAHHVKGAVGHRMDAAAMLDLAEREE